MNISQEIERLKGLGDYYAAGRLAGANGHDANYGCHFGMRSTLETARALYKAGHQSGRAIVELERRAAVNKAIARSKPKIGAREARAIHALLAPRKWER
jgi:hypothetical protein